MCERPGFEAGVWGKPNKLGEISHLSQTCRVPRLPDMGIELLHAGQWGLGPCEESPGEKSGSVCFPWSGQPVQPHPLPLPCDSSLLCVLDSKFPMCYLSSLWVTVLLKWSFGCSGNQRGAGLWASKISGATLAVQVLIHCLSSLLSLSLSLSEISKSEVF